MSVLTEKKIHYKEVPGCDRKMTFYMNKYNFCEQFSCKIIHICDQFDSSLMHKPLNITLSFAVFSPSSILLKLISLLKVLSSEEHF